MRRDLVVIGASAGGVEALRETVATLPADLPATVLVVLHVPAYAGSVLPAILSRAGPLPARHACSDEVMRPGTVLVAPPDRHLVVHDDRVLLSRGPKENSHRPAVDVLFRTAARAAGGRVIAIVLSGVLDDGTAGLQAVQQRGGLTVVQDPDDALYPGMPQSALDHLTADYICKASEIGGLVSELCRTAVDGAQPEPSPLLELESDIAMMEDTTTSPPERPGKPAGYSCPDCAGPLFEIRDGELIRYRCRVGHAWSAQSLFGEQAMQLDSALWMALRSLEEKAALARELGSRAEQRSSPLTARRFAEQAEESSRAASLIRSILQEPFEFAERLESGDAERW